jgi:hypothetical protein
VVISVSRDRDMREASNSGGQRRRSSINDAHLRFNDAHLRFNDAHLRFNDAHLRIADASLDRLRDSDLYSNKCSSFPQMQIERSD